jgi:hypothetical protein
MTRPSAPGVGTKAASEIEGAKTTMLRLASRPQPAREVVKLADVKDNCDLSRIAEPERAERIAIIAGPSQCSKRGAEALRSADALYSRRGGECPGRLDCRARPP